MKKIILVLISVFISLVLAGCGEKVDVPPAAVGKIVGKNGYQEGIKNTSKFRLDPCWWPGAYCDKLVLLNVNDFATTENFELFMPKDRLNMKFDVRLTLTVDPDSYEQLFNKVSPIQSQIPLKKVYDIYAQQILRSEAREFMSKYSIMEVANNRDVIGAELAEHLSKTINGKTPFLVRYAGLADVAYPPIIVTAQENAAERREMIQQEKAQLEVSKVQLDRKLQEQTMQRKIDVEKARSEAEVNKIIGESITDKYVTYRNLDILGKFAASSNTKVIPIEMMSSLSSQVMLGNEMSE